MSCARCRTQRGEIARSERLGEFVCFRCYCDATAEADQADAERIERQRAIARAIRSQAERVSGPLREQLRARALLLELSDDEATVQALLAEVRALGLRVEVEG